ncbi:MAG TPA: nitric-oxide reductase large subunit [Candidatus Hydrogenedentes bacterium]|nr:nitric-oxide reductase large subunit [Candidatus Hydrogenedentota bacterium]HQE83046.1 nitric-oxide reductase large subunit [Candidatus Hydrogenedentota bacterium]HQH53450.1 nitric-oxide reductase large subunit [Candidatus Hydrogenedentota bacterium]HQM50966.1 nitric-oxide reductase large subunit [Candidatus Hydrogenedentota bacterium]
MNMDSSSLERLSPWWKNAVILVMILGFSVLIGLAVKSYKDAPPIPDEVVGPGGAAVFTAEDIRSGQEVFLKYGLMENGTVWGHGAYLGPDFSAKYLHQQTLDSYEFLARQKFGADWGGLTPEQQDVIQGEVARDTRINRYDAAKGVLTLTPAQAYSFEKQQEQWREFFAAPVNNFGLPTTYIADPKELRQVTTFFFWTAWACATNRPGEVFSYTNNFPYDPAVDNLPTHGAILWSALSLIALLGGTGLALFAFGRFDFLGWQEKEHRHPQLLSSTLTDGQRATLKYFAVAALLFLGQSLIGGAIAHYRAEPANFYGLDLSTLLPSNILRTWHLQLAIFWVATCFVAGGLWLASAVNRKESKGQVFGIHFLFAALVVVVVGSLLGEWLGINRLLGGFWFWLGHQGWEYLDLGRAWQVLLAVGLLVWLVLIARAVWPVRNDPEKGQIASLFLYAAVGIPLFYVPAMFFASRTNLTVVDMWRFWIIHLWVEGFFELFVTTMVALMFFLLGMVSRTTALRVVYLDAILYLGSGIIGTGHHWYWTGQSHVAMAFSAVFSALEVVPLTLLTLDAWDFISLSSRDCAECGKKVAIPHRWTFYFLMAVGFWNFLGAGVFGFLINLPIVSYFEVGTLLTPNHGHAAMMGVFGMLGVALMVFAFREASTDKEWQRIGKLVGVAFFGLNTGLLLMIVTNLFPGGVYQLYDVLANGYWHARSPEFLTNGLMHTIEWLRLPADAVFIGLGCVPLGLAGLWVYAKAWFSVQPDER